ncbi:hypothetical protein PCANC_20381 [Puccinia coronata f. sp. avenae]|uniref:Uncharacterized protein n=1 Tax=Puccinia coronata f. sp. avenae TaxID=200324 RepID=A0A2N5UEU8_9BASI|nr:hypothetical protein PCANC_20381 [Puccinia coronata f. sp. avenae]
MYKILRCFKALLLTDLEKKPGNLTTRQVLVEIIQGCFQLDEFLRARPMDGALLGWTVPIVIEPSHPAARQLDCNPDKIQEPLANEQLNRVHHQPARQSPLAAKPTCSRCSSPLQRQ